MAVRPENQTEHTSQPQGGPRETRHPENQKPLEGKVAGTYGYLLNSPQISSTRHELPADVKDFNHHFAGDGKKKK
jgi:hypothetical protein